MADLTTDPLANPMTDNMHNWPQDRPHDLPRDSLYDWPKLWWQGSFALLRWLKHTFPSA